MPDPAEVRAAGSRVRLTRGGAAAVFAGGALLVTGRLFGVLELFVLGAGMLGLVLLSVARSAVSRPALDVQRTLEPARPEVGDDARVRLRLTATAPSPALELWEPVSGLGGAAMRVAPLRRGEVVVAGYRIPTLRRGVVTVGPLSADVRDVFGLALRRTWLGPQRRALVHPRALPVPLPRLGSGQGALSLWLARRVMSQGASDEFRSLRDYVAGDDLRRVNWRRSAARDGLVVRETDPGSTLELVVVFDLHANRYTSEGFERAVSVVASLVVSAVREDRRMRLVTTDSDQHVVDAVHLDEILEHLALVQPATGRVPPSSTKHGGGTSVAVVVTGTVDPHRLSLLRAAAGQPEGAVVVACEPGGAPPTGWFTVRAEDLTSFQEAWDELVSGGRLGARA